MIEIILNWIFYVCVFNDKLRYDEWIGLYAWNKITNKIIWFHIIVPIYRVTSIFLFYCWYTSYFKFKNVLFAYDLESINLLLRKLYFTIAIKAVYSVQKYYFNHEYGSTYFAVLYIFDSFWKFCRTASEFHQVLYFYFSTLLREYDDFF